MSLAKEETEKRLSIARSFNEQVKKDVVAVILIGSVAYGPNVSVTEDSDLDLIVVYKDIKDCISQYFKEEAEKEHLRSESYDGFLVKRRVQGVPVSIHNITQKALNKIVSAKYECLSYYRQGAKNITYYSKDFNEKSHPFQVQSIPIPGLMGVKRIDPIAFEVNGNFVMGNDIDKLLSGAVVMHDTRQIAKKSIKNLWKVIASKLVDHCRVNGNDEKILKADVSKYLHREGRFSTVVREAIKIKTQEAIQLVI